VARLADLVKCVDQFVLALGLERNVEVDRRAIGRVTQLSGDSFPLVLYNHVIPRRREGRRRTTALCALSLSEATKECGSTDQEHREPAGAHKMRHNYERSPVTSCSEGWRSREP
jgi:hypothetical protein